VNHPPQLDLFAAAAPSTDPHPVLPAAPDEHWLALAAKLPAAIRLGTSSWHFPGWARLVYDRVAHERVLGRDGLRAYARHPLLGCVGLDRSFYAPMAAADFRHYAEQVPDAFRFVVKAPMACTASTSRSEPGARPAPNPLFLDAAFATDRFVGPCLEGLEDKAGVLVFQFPPLGWEHTRQPAGFAERLLAFLERLPAGPLYAVELRDHALLVPEYLAALRGAKAHHCIGLHPRMPVASEQARETGLDHSGPLVVRWNLHAGFAYEQAKVRYTPFTRLVDEDLPNRVALARLCLDAAARGEPAFVIANNKAEGSAPLTLLKLAEQIAAHASHEPRAGERSIPAARL
jgi:uncharacterized protein YecE (DUF72 family)